MPDDHRMVPETRIDVDVEVLIDGTWWPGVLHHWRQRDGHWEGWVRWSAGVGQNHLGWYAQEQLRAAGSRATGPA